MIDKSKIIIKEPIYIAEDDGCLAFVLYVIAKTFVAIAMLYIFYLIIK